MEAKETTQVRHACRSRFYKVLCCVVVAAAATAARFVAKKDAAHG